LCNVACDADMHTYASGVSCLQSHFISAQVTWQQHQARTRGDPNWQAAGKNVPESRGGHLQTMRPEEIGMVGVPVFRHAEFVDPHVCVSALLTGVYA